MIAEYDCCRTERHGKEFGSVAATECVHFRDTCGEFSFPVHWLRRSLSPLGWGGGGVATLLNRLYGYVPPLRVWVFWAKLVRKSVDILPEKSGKVYGFRK